MILKRILRKIICSFKSWILTKRYVDKGSGRIVAKDPLLKINIKKEQGAIFELNGIFKIKPYLNGNIPVNIILSSDSNLVIDGDFDIGHGITIFLASKAKLYILYSYKKIEERIKIKEIIISKFKKQND